jgi:ABC-type thiamine transport system ATPase subunit
MTAIMGASGAGKTTLLNIISCRVPLTSDMSQKKPGVAFGKIFANNTPYSFQNFGDFANYVMQ